MPSAATMTSPLKIRLRYPVGRNRGMTFVCRSSISSIRPETPIIYFSMGEMQNVTAIMAVFLKDSHNPIINKFCDCAAQSLKRI